MFFQNQERIHLAQIPTPLQPLDRLSEVLGGPKIWLKRDDLTGTTLSGNKIRKLEYVLAQANKEGADVLMTCGGVQSNHCRTTAIVAAQLGLKCHLILRGSQPKILDGNTLLAELSGAKISYYPVKKYTHQSDQIVEHWRNSYKEKGEKVFWIPTGASDEIGLWGYYSAVKELYEDFERLKLNVGAVCCATGSGGTHTGLALGFHHLQLESPELNIKVQAYAVCDNKAYFANKADQDVRSWYERYYPNKEILQPKIHVNDTFIGAGYGIADRGVYETIRLLAGLEGVVLDPVYTGKAFQGLVHDIKKGLYDYCDNIVFVHTGGVFGLFPFKGDL